MFLYFLLIYLYFLLVLDGCLKLNKNIVYIKMGIKMQYFYLILSIYLVLIEDIDILIEDIEICLVELYVFD